MRRPSLLVFVVLDSVQVPQRPGQGLRPLRDPYAVEVGEGND
ncbi:MULTISPECIES: hypothetical protein [Streptomyces]|uniref:Uncharacterized protein n=1 Tax=Streptomyces fradiae ATCC 10745 = DSM 40063 TaxID=1319510 RepID=A0ABQ6Y1Z3_STRFR|nr:MULTISPECIES: hypothetical protein [Streptomyces]KAF0651680.1 hypothetical protein K701_01740 [Streptomyces fradiae ATCC 10745 = DSM 40063]